MDPNLLTIVLCILSIICGFFGNLIHEKLIDRYRFERNGGRIISGEYHAVWYTNDSLDRIKPVTWEKAIIKQKGRKIKYSCHDNDLGFDYEYIGVIREDIISGHWVSKRQGENVKGGGTLFISKRGYIVGMWVGDCQMSNFSWGYWAIAKDKAILEKFVDNMQSILEFKAVDLLTLFDEILENSSQKNEMPMN